MKFTLDLPPRLVAGLRQEGAYALLVPPSEEPCAARWQARQILAAGLAALQAAGPERPRDIAFDLRQLRHPSAQ